MSLNTAVSGINAAQAALDVTSNDLANVNTAGFKSGAQRFAAVYPPGAGVAGIGVQTKGIERSYQQGPTITTDNPLDLTVQGQGFFVTSHNGVQRYTRDGQFHLDPDSNTIVTATGDAVLGYPGKSQAAGSVSPLTINKGTEPANATTAVGVGLNLDTGDSVIAASTPFDPANPASYNESTSVRAYDSLGNPNRVELYFREQAGNGASPASWQVYAEPLSPDGATIAPASALTSLSFDSTGKLTGGSPAALNVNWGKGAQATTIAFNFGGTTLAAQKFGVNTVTNDGYEPGQFQDLQIAQDGTVQALYSNGQKAPVGRIALASFTNNQGLSPVSDNAFLSTTTSGNAIINVPGQGQTGTLAAGKLEQSNVNVSARLVDLITEQQAYQANTKTISTERANVQRLLQI
jgi:flagellar hook protein FlgE